MTQLPVVVVGAGPIGLTAALGLEHYGIPYVLLEEDATLSSDTKAGTTLSRTLEIWNRYGAVDRILGAALRIDEIGDIDRATNTPRASVQLAELANDTQFPFVINLPQQKMEPLLAAALSTPVRTQHRMTSFDVRDDRVVLQVETPDGPQELEASYLLACDGGRSRIRDALGVKVVGETLPERYMLIDVVVDLDVNNARDYPYLAYFADKSEWMVLIRQPDNWRFLFPLAPGADAPDDEDLLVKVKQFIGEVDRIELLGSVVYNVHHRVAEQWTKDRRVFLMGDAAHLITPMWALGLNTGALDASNLPWRLAWVLRGWAEPSLLDGYEQEQRPVAIEGSGEMAEAARKYMSFQQGAVTAGTSDWATAYTRTLLSVRLDVDGSGDWSMVATSAEPPTVRAGDRAPDLVLQSPTGRVTIHDLCRDSFVALYFTDVRRRPEIPVNGSPALQHYAVSRWDAPHDSGLRDRALFDPGSVATKRYGVPPETVVLLRPDGHVAAVAPMGTGVAEELYSRITGREVP
ncbi:3-(3-hydroxy-phenyl)propionate hydroxylase [Kribbella rubisoli]|uniref:3-(3-hydroxy-phenyl)propionate hydroxylase n=1 Tax=Kribbella rubisoli TaxID=3075929 RepID=A0A4Q7VY00_9ACTN|nr:FAD-dependent monooxygenase [Kribbella rubisoli]RZU01445.1 3-(3-hydroxy-phenyl)propionate hydroxylase [Kribbella rubisoli]